MSTVTSRRSPPNAKAPSRAHQGRPRAAFLDQGNADPIVGNDFFEILEHMIEHLIEKHAGVHPFGDFAKRFDFGEFKIESAADGDQRLAHVLDRDRIQNREFPGRCIGNNVVRRAPKHLGSSIISRVRFMSPQLRPQRQEQVVIGFQP